jgi:hypothetical protein
MQRGPALFAVAIVVALLVAAPAGAATVSPPSKDFGSQIQGTAGDATSFTLSTSFTTCAMPCISPTVSNVDTTALAGGPGTTNTVGDFVVHNVDCQNPESSPPIAFVLVTCTFDVRLLPTATGALSKSLSFTDDHGPTATLSLAGTGLAPPPAPASTSTPVPRRKKCRHKHRHASAAKKCKKHR